MREQRREWAPGRPVDAHVTLSVHRRGAGDPAYRRTPDGAVWRTARTPEGPGTVRIGVRRADGVVVASSWGPGAGWLLAALPAWLGEGDDASGFEPGHPLLRDVYGRLPGWRVGRSGLVLEALVPAVLEQLVTGGEARRSWRELLSRYGEPAPGPASGAPAGMHVVPEPAGLASLPSWEWHRAGVCPRRSRTIVRAALVASQLERTLALGRAEAEYALRSLPGIGVWTAAEVMQRAHGDPDAVSVGDLHLPGRVGWALTGRVLDDAGMLACLERWRGHRYRVIRLVEMSGLAPPRRGPRFAPRDYRAM